MSFSKNVGNFGLYVPQIMGAASKHIQNQHFVIYINVIGGIYAWPSYVSFLLLASLENDPENKSI